jgi:hypothetical protein
MKQVNALKHEFVKGLPDKLEDGILTSSSGHRVRDVFTSFPSAVTGNQ